VSRARPSEARLYALLGLMLLFWSLNYVVGKVALREFPPVLLTCLRTTIAGVFILPIYLWRERGKPSAWTSRELGELLLLGIYGVIANQLFFVLGLAWTSVAHAAVIMTLMPILVLLLAAFLGQERITARKVVGMTIAAAGVGVLQLERKSGSGATLLGDCCTFLCGISLAVFTVRSKQLMKRFGSLMINSVAYIGGSLAIAPLTIWLSVRYGVGRASAAAWWSVAYMAVFSSVLAYFIYNYALTYMPASRASAVSYLQPLGATLLAVLLLGEPVTIALAMGGILVLTGVFVTERA
jgi:drug/metabolite transporter (DMT)-like permease